MSKIHRGFTVIELLIVIVVIAILATIATLAYNGVQQRSKNLITIDAAKSWVDLLSINYSRNGQMNVDFWALPSGANGICLGDKSDYPATDHLREGECYQNMYVADDVRATLAKLGSVHMKTFEIDTDGDSNFSRGVQYSFDGHAFVWYDLIGKNQDCVLKDSEMLATNDVGTTCQVDMTKLLGKAPLNFG